MVCEAQSLAWRHRLLNASLLAREHRGSTDLRMQAPNDTRKPSPKKEGCMLAYVGTKVIFLVFVLLSSSTTRQHPQFAKPHPSLDRISFGASKPGIYAPEYNLDADQF